ncbi:PREDICTED: glutamate--cysteine ligase regulatory subunit-like [Priapulus caudatus]|uniref:GCS light chain n=1 Tax=Priapulus caudatus TaxID=37621 RepID=A0ABM1EEX9_PRICU|nr:PREDICTED: glutamate--cysteine ligase regulatory subunit-like [Priapulus caudatus]
MAEPNVNPHHIQLKAAENLIIHTGNIASWSRLRMTTTSPAEELVESIRATLQAWSPLVNNEEIQAQTTVQACHGTYIEKVSDAERSQLKLTVKLFMTQWDPEAIKEGVKRTLCELGVSQLDVLILACPDTPDDEMSLDLIKPLWLILEGMVEQRLLLSLGIADLQKETLEQLYNWAKVKPNIDHWNSVLCCVMPEDLVAFAKQHDIQLLSHSDERNILLSESLQAVVSSTCSDQAGERWQTHWVLRYALIVRSRGILTSKGYIVKATRS